MSKTGFNYATPAFRRHASHAGFWLYAEPAPGPTVRFRIRLTEGALRRMPSHVFRSLGVVRSSRRASDMAA